MRPALRLLATVKQANFLEPGAPTGLTGLLTHASPRSTLLYHYHATLDKLKAIPSSSVYRQSTEALTRHRLAIIEASKPAGWDDWSARIATQIADDPTLHNIISAGEGTVVEISKRRNVDEREHAAAWDGEVASHFPEGIRTERERRSQLRNLGGGEDYQPEREVKPTVLAPEPQYTAEAISDLESKLGAGLLEEVIQVAEGEHKLVDEMIKNRVWEPLEEPVPEGQWTYFERSTHNFTQKP